jgi:membrane protease YdiL (CAAX protease family)
MVAVNWAIRFVARLIPGMPHGSASEFHMHISDAMARADVGSIVFYLVIACLMAPLIEETLFRVLLYPWLRQRCGIVLAILINALLFAAYHLDALGFVQYFGLGLVLAATYERTRSLPVVATIHAMWNTWAMLLMWALTPR